MSKEAVKWAMDDAPMLLTKAKKPDTTARHVLQALAEHAHADGSGAHPSVLRLQYRTGYDRVTVQRALRRLQAGKLISPIGSVSGRTEWRLALDARRPASDWQQLEDGEDAGRAAAAERKRKSRAKAVTNSESVTVTDAESVTDGDVTNSESVRHASEVRDVTNSESGRHALNAALTIKEPPPQPPTTKNTSEPGGSEGDSLTDPLALDSSGNTAPQRDYRLDQFGAFWTVYPRSKQIEKAKRAWRDAIDRGADPEHLVAAATAYAHERKDQEAKFTPYPARWLDDGRYDDEPDPQPAKGRHLRAVGDWQPFQPPTDHSVYESGF
ncbi:hypothetical protein [Streptomyces sp. NPDC006784]|uniref:hypothetical protein n=1 Tax=Streptomyces sp. NPDC006784 TaxID=3364764 RepID=UPI003679104B